MSPERRPWVAVLVGFLFGPGIGQLYNGKLRKAAAFVIGLPIALALCLRMMMALQAQPWNVLVPICGLVAFVIVSWVDAARDAHRLRQVPRPWYGRWHACLVAGFLNTFVILPASVVVMRTTSAQAFQLPAGSMEPTLLIGDRFLVDKTAYGIRFGSTIIAARPPARGDVVVFLYPPDRTKEYVKRVIGLPGETVEVRGRVVSIDGRALDEPYARFLSEGDSLLSDEQQGDDLGHRWGPQPVPAGHVFVLGDNRDNSADSRFFGCVALQDVLGKVRVVYFSRESARSEYSREEKSPAGSVRWARIGHVVR